MDSVVSSMLHYYYYNTIQINKTTSNSNKNMGETHAKKYDKSCHKQQANNPDYQTYNIW